nr:unnamed protein product [Naegleria fowleri]
MARVNEFLKQSSLIRGEEDEESDLSTSSFCSQQTHLKTLNSSSLSGVDTPHDLTRCKHTFHNSSQIPLPDEIIQYHIAPYMDVKTLCSKFFLLSSYLKKLVDENHIWKERFFRVLPYSQFDFFENNPIYWKKCYHSEVTRRYFSSLNTAHQDRIYPSLDELSVSFKDLYRTLYVEGKLSKQRLLNSGNYKRDQYSHHITYYYLIDMFESVKLEHDKLRCIEQFFGQQVGPGVEFFRGRTREKGALHDDETREYYGVFGLVVGVYFVMFQEWMSNDLRAHVFGRKINHRMVETYDLNHLQQNHHDHTNLPSSHHHLDHHRHNNMLHIRTYPSTNFQSQQQHAAPLWNDSSSSGSGSHSCPSSVTNTTTATSTTTTLNRPMRMRGSFKRIPLFASTPRHHHPHWLLHEADRDDEEGDDDTDFLMEDEDAVMTATNTTNNTNNMHESSSSMLSPSNHDLLMQDEDEEIQQVTSSSCPLNHVFPQYLFLSQPTEDKWDQQQKHDSPVSVVIHGVWSDNKERCGLFTSENIDWSTTVFDLSTLGSKLYDINYKRLYSVENEVKMFSRMTAFKYWRMVVNYSLGLPSYREEEGWNLHQQNLSTSSSGSSTGSSSADGNRDAMQQQSQQQHAHSYAVREYNVTFDCDTYLRGEAALCHHHHHDGMDPHLHQGGPSQQQHAPHFQIVGNAMDSYISFNMLSRGEHIFLAWCQFDHMKQESKIKTKSALRSKIIYPNNRRDSFACLEPPSVNLNVNEFRLSGIILDREGIKGHLTLEPLPMNHQHHHHHHHVNQ